MVQSNRNFSLDFLKAISIFGVVFIHGSGIGGIHSEYQDFIRAFFRFSVPCFIIIWAYFFEKSFKKQENSKRGFIKNKFIRLLKIYFFWSILYFIINVSWENLTIKKLLLSHLIYGWMGQYFLVILLQLTLFYKYIRLTYKNKFLKYFITAIIILFFIFRTFFTDLLPEYVLKISYIPFVYWLPYVYTGIFFANNEFKLNKYLVFSILLIPFEHLLFIRYNIRNLIYISPGVLIASIVLVGLFLKSKFKIHNLYVSNIIGYVGKNTMTVFLVNPLLIMVLKNIFSILNVNYGSFSYEIEIIISIMNTIVILCLCLCFIPLIKWLKLNGKIN